MVCSTKNALAAAGEPTPAEPAPIVDGPHNDREPMETEDLKLQELSSRIRAARSVH